MAVEIPSEGIAVFKAKKGVFAEIPGFNGVARTECFTINFELAGGGMGDYICWLPALQWLAKNSPWVHGIVWSPAYFIQLPKELFKGVKNWEVKLIERYKDEADKGTLCRGLLTTPAQLINATGAHLLKIGFMNFANLDDLPEGTTYPQLDLSNTKLNKKLRGLEKKYVVFTPGGTTKSRFVSGKYWNPIIDWVIDQGLTPVFLGKEQLVDTHRSYFDPETDYHKGIDLRESTSLFEAAKIMQESACVIGLDNGLLHLAACTDASIVFGYNMVHPKERRPVRPSGRLVEVYPDEKLLGCTFCQTKYKLLYTHNFKNCIRNDTACIDLMFGQEGLYWKQAIAGILK